MGKKIKVFKNKNIVDEKVDFIHDNLQEQINGLRKVNIILFQEIQKLREHFEITIELLKMITKR